MSERKSIHSTTQAIASVAGGGAAMFALVCLTALPVYHLHGAEPRIDHIEWFARFPDTVTIHFYTEANRTYTLQYRDLVSTTGVTNLPPSATNWVNHTTVDRLPFPQHFVIADTRTNSPQRFYRLRVTP
jgi:hypothetical protein